MSNSIKAIINVSLSNRSQPSYQLTNFHMVKSYLLDYLNLRHILLYEVVRDPSNADTLRTDEDQLYFFKSYSTKRLIGNVIKITPSSHCDIDIMLQASSRTHE